METDRQKMAGLLYKREFGNASEKENAARRIANLIMTRDTGYQKIESPIRQAELADAMRELKRMKQSGHIGDAYGADTDDLRAELRRKYPILGTIPVPVLQRMHNLA